RVADHHDVFHLRIWRAAVLRDGSACRQPDQGASRPGCHQSDLPADGFSLRPMVSAIDPPRFPATAWAGLAELSSEPAGPGRGRVGAWGSLDARGRAGDL